MLVTPFKEQKYLYNSIEFNIFFMVQLVLRSGYRYLSHKGLISRSSHVLTFFAIHLSLENGPTTVT